MDIALQDYVAARIGKKDYVFRVTAMNDSAVAGIVEHNEDKQDNVSVERKDVLTNLGPNPLAGKVYKAKIDQVLAHTDHDTFGRIRYYVDLTEDDKTTILSALDFVALRLLNTRTTAFLPNLVNSVRLRVGKTLGSYVYSGKEDTESSPDYIRHMVKPGSIQEGSHAYMVAHECGHGFWHRVMKSKQRTAWVKLFLSRVSVEEKDLSALVEPTFKACILEKKRPEGEDQKIVLGRITASFKAAGVGKSSLKHLTENAETDSLKSLLPSKVLVRLVNKEMLVSQYAGTNPGEFFAECFAHWICLGSGVLDKEASDLLEATIKITGSLWTNKDCQESKENLGYDIAVLNKAFAPEGVAAGTVEVSSSGQVAHESDSTDAEAAVAPTSDELFDL